MYVDEHSPLPTNYKAGNIDQKNCVGVVFCQEVSTGSLATIYSLIALIPNTGIEKQSAKNLEFRILILIDPAFKNRHLEDF